MAFPKQKLRKRENFIFFLSSDAAKFVNKCDKTILIIYKISHLNTYLNKNTCLQDVVSPSSSARRHNLFQTSWRRLKDVCVHWEEDEFSHWKKLSCFFDCFWLFVFMIALIGTPIEGCFFTKKNCFSIPKICLNSR